MSGYVMSCNFLWSYVETSPLHPLAANSFHRKGANALSKFHWKLPDMRNYSFVQIVCIRHSKQLVIHFSGVEMLLGALEILIRPVQCTSLSDWSSRTIVISNRKMEAMVKSYRLLKNNGDQ